MTSLGFLVFAVSMMSLWCVSMFHVVVAFFPPALTFPENPNSIDSPLAWHPLSTGIGKLPPGSLRAWWDASKLNANDIYWGMPSFPHYPCHGQTDYFVNGTANSNTVAMHRNGYWDSSLASLIVPGLLFRLANGDGTAYQIMSVVNSNTFIVSPNFTSNVSNAHIVFSQLVKWPDLSGNREHMGFWAVADTYNPSIYMLDSASGRIFRDGEVYHFGNGAQTLTGLTDGDVFRIGHPVGDGEVRNAVVVHEMIIGQGTLSAGQRADMEGYLAWKWQTQLQLPLQHSYATLAPPTPWNPSQLGNDLTFWLDANRDSSVFANSSCSEAAGADKRVACWQDLSNYGRHVYQNANFPIYHTTEEGLKGVYIPQNSRENPSFLATTGGATWLNNQNYFVAVVAKRSDKDGGFHYRGGPLEIGTKSFFPLMNEHCIGAETVAGNPAAYTPNFPQRTTLVLQGNARNQPFYQPYFNRNMPSSLTTRRPPTYLHEQPYLIALVADFTELLQDLNWNVPTLFGIVHPGGTYNQSVYTHRLFVLGMAPHFPGKFVVDHGWGGMAAYDYEVPLNSKAVYLVWRKDNALPPIATINGKQQQIRFEDPQSNQAYLKVFTDRINMLAMGDHHFGGVRRFSGSIYEAMVLTGPKIKYGHQRLIEGYLAWKWGLQHLLPRSHSYRRVPPAR